MCGIVGFITTDYDNANLKVESFFKQALFADTLRGSHSTGIFAANTWEDEVISFKKAISAPDFLELSTVENIISPPTWTWNILIGHNRYATKGGITNRTAHPFTYDNITLVHNGTLDSHKHLKGAENISSDSEAICKAFSLEDPEKVIEQLEGSFTLVWYDNEKRTVNFIRNEERPFTYAKVKNSDTLLLSSESEMLKWIANRNSMELEYTVNPKPGELISFFPSEVDKEWTSHPKVTSLSLKDTKKWWKYGGYGGYGRQGNCDDYVNTSKNFPTTTYSPPSQASQDLKNNLGLSHGEEVIITEHEFIPYPSTKDVGRVVGKIADISTDFLYRIELSPFQRDEYEDFYKNEDILTEIKYSYTSLSEKDKKDVLIIVADNTQYWVLDNSSGNLPKEEEDVITLIKGPDGMITIREFKDLTKNGCAYCTGNVYEDEAEKIGWTNDRQPVCPDCIHDLKLEEYVG